MCAGWRQERLHATELREVELERVSVPPRFRSCQRTHASDPARIEGGIHPKKEVDLSGNP